MKHNYIGFLALVILFFLLILDGQISTLVTNFLPGKWAINSHLLFIVGIFFTYFLEIRYSLLIFTFLGLVYDFHYLGILGIAVTLFPLSILFIYYFGKGLLAPRVMNGAMLVTVVFLIEFLGFLFARLFHITNLSVYILLVFHFVPSLIVNLLLFLVLSPLLERIFGLTNKT